MMPVRRSGGRRANVSAARVVAGASVLVVLLLTTSGAAALPGAVDWDRRIARCSGLAPPTLREESENVAVTRVRTDRAAGRDAVRSCLETLGTITIVSGQTAGALLERDRALAAAVEAIVEEAVKASEPRFFSDGGVAIEVAVPLDGALSALLITAAAPPAAGTPPAAPATATQAGGIIVDARGVAVVPALAPRILDDGGTAVATPGMLTQQARRSGGGAYAGSMDAAQRSPRIGAAPIIVKAVGARGCDLVVTAADAAALRGQAAAAEGRIVIVRGPSNRDPRRAPRGGPRGVGHTGGLAPRS